VSINRYDHFIDGGWAAPASKEYFGSIDPATGQVFAEVARGRAEDVDRAVNAARRASATWRKVEASERGRILHRISARILKEMGELARLETLDTGFPLRDSLLVTETVAARHFEYYGGLADKLCGETVPVPGNNFDYTLREPLGIVAAIIPWNSPLYEGSRCIAPALAAGNTVVLKPAEQAMVTMLRLAEIATEEGLPAGALNVVTGFGPEAGASLASHPGIDCLSFTGSIETGTGVMKLAADNVVPVWLELGGKSANIVFADADIDTAVMWAKYAIFTASGQVCVAGSRLVLNQKVHDEFMEKIVAATRELRVGPGLENPDLGPVISEEQMSRVLNYIEVGKTEGASVAVGGVRLTEGEMSKGYFIAPTIFDGVKNEMRISQEEIFGPVLSVLTFDNADEALSIANGTQYGLAAAVWTRNLKTAHYMARNLEAGSVYVNRYFPAGLEAPAGAFKRSGFGSVDGAETMRQLTRIKNVVIGLD
jgi:acyl-CoA reductase-like NAD-dependent aldehyde dehydrogenase